LGRSFIFLLGAVLMWYRSWGTGVACLMIGATELLAQIPGSSFPNSTNQGPSTSRTPYVVPTLPGVKTVSLFSVGTQDTTGTVALDTVNLKSVANGDPAGFAGQPYVMVGLPDGLGAYSNGDGTFTLLANHEFGSTDGVTRAHGATGAFLSKWTINSSTLAVTNGQDLIRQVSTWNTTTSSFNAPTTGVAMGRFCSATLAPVSAFFNPNTGLGFNGRLMLGGEEVGAEGRAFAHVATGTNAGTSYQLPHLGRASWENVIPNPNASNKTIVMLNDDTSPGQVYMYVGTKQASGSPIDMAGLTNGTLYGISVSGLNGSGSANNETTAIIPNNTAFASIDLSAAPYSFTPNMTGATLHNVSNNSPTGLTDFARPEDGAWDPRPGFENRYYFATTGNASAPSRLYQFTFTDINNPQLGGTIQTLLDGTELHANLDNLAVDKYGHVVLQEDTGSSSRTARIWSYDLGTDLLVELARADQSRFGSESTSATGPFNTGEETSGIIDASDMLGPGWFLLTTQAHYTTGGLTAEMLEGGQLLALYSPLSVPEPGFYGVLAIVLALGLRTIQRRSAA
jgi:hypothetical protein